MYEGAEIGNGTASNEVVIMAQCFSASDNRLNIFKIQTFYDIFYHEYFFAHGVYQRELSVRIKNG